MTVGILDQAGLFTKYFRTNLPAGFDAGLQLIVVSGPESLDGLSLDLLAVAPDLRSGRWEEDFHLSCRLLLLPGTAASLARRLHAASVVSYGSSPRDTLTISSLETGKIVVALQRDLITAQNSLVEQQELILPLRGTVPPLFFLACAGLLLLLGISPEALDLYPPRDTSVPIPH